MRSWTWPSAGAPAERRPRGDWRAMWLAPTIGVTMAQAGENIDLETRVDQELGEVSRRLIRALEAARGGWTDDTTVVSRARDILMLEHRYLTTGRIVGGVACVRDRAAHHLRHSHAGVSPSGRSARSSCARRRARPWLCARGRSRWPRGRRSRRSCGRLPKAGRAAMRRTTGLTLCSDRDIFNYPHMRICTCIGVRVRKCARACGNKVLVEAVHAEAYARSGMASVRAGAL